MRLAYLTTSYPAVSHTFIRRELLEMERRGHGMLRLAIRPTASPLVDPLDREEQTKTLHCLSQPLHKLLVAPLRAMAAGPLRFYRALRLAIRMGWRSDRGLLRHLAYLAEAAYFLPVLRSEAVEHVHTHFGTNSTAVARLIHRLGGPPYSFTVHGPDEFDAPRQLDLAGKVADAAFVVAISDYGAAQLRRWTACDDWPKIHVVRCTVDEEFVRAAQPIDPASRTFVCVGRLCPQKGQLLLLEAFAEVLRVDPTARLVLAGDGEMRPQIEAKIRDLRLDDSVEITGWIDGAEVRRRLLAARALVLPSFAEGLPVVIMEALALGRPVISTYIAGIPELVKPGENGWLVPAGNVGELANAIQVALEMPTEQLGAMGTAGRRLVMDRHCLAMQARDLEALIMGHAVKSECSRHATNAAHP